MARESPEITAFIPPSQECPTIAARKITTSELDDRCARVVVEEILTEKLGKHEWTIDFFTTPVTLEVKRKKSTKEYTWDPSEFQCLQEFLDSIRSRLPQPNIVELRKDFQSDLASIIEQVRNACVSTKVETVELDRVPSEADVVVERIRNTLGLAQLKQPSRRLANLQRTDMRRIPRSERGIIKIARWLGQVEALKKVVLG